MIVFKLLLNFPWTFLTLLAALVSLPQKLTIIRKPVAIVIDVKTFWWKRNKNVRATTSGNVILMGEHTEKGDLRHELIHVEQAMRAPFIHPFLYIYELLRHGYSHNKYEVEAFKKAGNPHRLPDGTFYYYK